MTRKIAYTALVIILTSCNFSTGFSTNFDGISYKYNGISPEIVKVIDQTSLEPVENKKLKKYHTYQLVLSDISGLVIQQDGYSIGASLKIVHTSSGETLLENPDLFEGMQLEKANNTIFIKLWLGTSFHENQDYELTSKIWDKKDSTSIIHTSYKFKVSANDITPKYDVETNGIKFNNIILMDQSNKLVTNYIKKHKNYQLIIDGIKGLELQNGKGKAKLTFGILDALEDVVFIKKMKSDEVTDTIVLSFDTDFDLNIVTLMLYLEDLNQPDKNTEVSIELSLKD